MLRFGTITIIVKHEVVISLGSLVAFELLGMPPDNLPNTPAYTRPAVENKAVHQGIGGRIIPANIEMGIRQEPAEGAGRSTGRHLVGPREQRDQTGHACEAFGLRPGTRGGSFALLTWLFCL